MGLEKASADVMLCTFVRGLATDLSGNLELPGFPAVVARLYRVLADNRSAAWQIVRVTSSETTVGAHLVRLANSAAFKPADRSINDLRSAITLLGLDLVRSSVTSFAVRQLEQQAWLKPLRPLLSRIWNESVAVAAIAFTGARQIKGVKPDEAMAAGLFHQLGILYALTHAHRAGIAIGDETEWANSIRDWHPTIARAILESWGMSAELGDAIQYQDALSDPDHADGAVLPPLTHLLSAAKLYHQPLQAPDADREALDAKLAAAAFDGRSLVDILASAREEMENVRQAIAR